MTDTATPLQIITLVIAVLGLGIAVASLTWQVGQFVLSGHRVSVELLGGGLGNGGVAVGPLSTAQPQSLVSEGFGQLVFAVRARNKGRMAVDVTGFDVKMDGGWALSLPGWHPNPSLPHRLDAGSTVTFYVPADQVLAAREAGRSVMGGSDDRFCGAVTLGTGEEVRSDWHAVK